MKRRLQVIIFLILGATLFQLLTISLLDRDTPDEIKLLLNSTKDNSDLMSKIGGFDSYKFSYNYVSRDARKDFDFEVTVFGKVGYIKFNGISQYNSKNNSWTISKIDTLFKHY